MNKKRSRAILPSDDDDDDDYDEDDQPLQQSEPASGQHNPQTDGNNSNSLPIVSNLSKFKRDSKVKKPRHNSEADICGIPLYDENEQRIGEWFRKRMEEHAPSAINVQDVEDAQDEDDDPYMDRVLDLIPATTTESNPDMMDAITLLRLPVTKIW